MTFLNAYGYDFQRNDKKQIKKWIERQNRYDVFPNLIAYIDQHKLEKEKHMKRLIKILKSYNSEKPFQVN